MYGPTSTPSPTTSAPPNKLIGTPPGHATGKLPLSAAKLPSSAAKLPSSSPKAAPNDDAELVARCLAGERQAWNTLVQRYQRLVYAIVMRMGMDEHDAADVFQTVFTRLMKHMARIEDPSRLQAWIVTTAKREALHQRKLAQRTISIHGDEDSEPWDMADEGPTAEQSLEHLQQVHALRLALDQLDERCRGLLMQLFADEDEALSYQEIAQRLATPVGSIGPTRSRCLDKLRRLMTGQDAPASAAVGTRAASKPS